jgi:hypothetical protein
VADFPLACFPSVKVVFQYRGLLSFALFSGRETADELFSVRSNSVVGAGAAGGERVNATINLGEIEIPNLLRFSVGRRRLGDYFKNSAPANLALPIISRPNLRH